MGLVQTSSSYMSTVYVNLVCMYALSPAPLHTSSFLYLILSLTPISHTHPSLFPPSHSSLTPHTHSSHLTLTLTPHSSHSLHSSHTHPRSHSLLTLTPHTPHTDTENVFRLMVWVLDDRQKKQLHSKAGVDMVSHLYYSSPLLCVCERHPSVSRPWQIILV